LRKEDAAISLNIKNAEADRLARELADLTGESLTEALTIACGNGSSVRAGEGDRAVCGRRSLGSRSGSRASRCSTGGRIRRYSAMTSTGFRADAPW
jgi:hypothetical protein